MIVYKCDRCYRLFNPVARMYPRYTIYKQNKQGKQLLNRDLCPDCEEECLIDDAKQIHCSEFGLAVIPGVDEFEVIG